MSKTVQIGSADQFESLIKSSTIVVADFYADWCGPCKAIAPLYEQLSAQLSRPGRITFTRINTDQQPQTTKKHGVRAMPTFLIFKQTKEVSRIQGANPKLLSEAVKKLAAEADSTSTASSSSTAGFGDASSSSSHWLGPVPKGYSDVTDQVDVRGLDLLNADPAAGAARVLFESSEPGKNTKEPGRDYIESDTDEQLMLYIPFQSTIKMHSLQLTSHAVSSLDDDTAEVARPARLRLYTNRISNLGFDEAGDVQATQVVEIKPGDWDAKTRTARVELRFVKFQNCSSVVMFVEGVEGSGEKCRIDRVRIVGETGEKREMGKLEKVGEDH